MYASFVWVCIYVHMYVFMYVFVWAFVQHPFKTSQKWCEHMLFIGPKHRMQIQLEQSTRNCIYVHKTILKGTDGTMRLMCKLSWNRHQQHISRLKRPGWQGKSWTWFFPQQEAINVYLMESDMRVLIEWLWHVRQHSTRWTGFWEACEDGITIVQVCQNNGMEYRRCNAEHGCIATCVKPYWPNVTQLVGTSTTSHGQPRTVPCQ